MREIEVALVRVPEHKRDDEKTVRDKFNTLIDIAGGLAFVKPGDSVLIKPIRQLRKTLSGHHGPEDHQDVD